MRSGRLSSLSAHAVYMLIVFTFGLQVVLGITTTHHDKPEDSQPKQMAQMMRTEDGFTISSPLTIADLTANTNATHQEMSERQKRLLPYMTFYLEQDFNRPYGQQPSGLSSYATTGAVKQPTILQQYHNKFTELTNGVSYPQQPQPPHSSGKIIFPGGKTRLTPFSHNNALPGPFLPMRNPGNPQLQPQLQPPTKSPSAKQPPNYSAIYDKLSQLKLQQQYQPTYTRQYPPQVLQVQVAHPLNSAPPVPPPPRQQDNYRHQLPQQVSYIPARDYVHIPYNTPQSPAKTIVQTYSPASIDIPTASDESDNNVEVGITHGGGDSNTSSGVDDQDEVYEPEQEQHVHLHHPHPLPVPVKTYNEPVKHYGYRLPPQSQPEFGKFPPNEVRKHVLKPVILVRPKATAGNNANGKQPYLILQRKPAQKPYDIDLQLPETLNFRPIKFNLPSKYHPQQQHHHQEQQRPQVPTPQHVEVNNEEVVVENVTPKYIDIIPKYEVKPTLHTYSPTYGRPYKYQSYQEPSDTSGSGPSESIRASIPHNLPTHSADLPRHQPQVIPLQTSRLTTPRPHIINYQRPIKITRPQEDTQDYIVTEDIKYQKPKFQPTVQVEYADDSDDDIDEAPITTRAPEPVYHHPPQRLHPQGKFSQPHSEDHKVYVTTPAPYTKLVYASAEPTKSTLVQPPTVTVSVSSEASHEQEVAVPEYQEGSNSLSLILKKLQDTNALPHTLTPDNIDNSIRTLVKILSGLKKTPKFQRPIVVQDDSGEYEGNNEAGVGLGEIPGTVTQIFPDNTPEGGTPGTPGVDYPALNSIPQTSFNCKTQRYKGFFGDPDTHCQVWHYCDLNGGQASFLCPNGTIFSQVALTCDWWYNVKCSNTAQLYVLNERLYKYILPLSPKFPEDYSGPLVDRYLALKFQEMEEKMKKERKPNKDTSDDAMTTAKANESSENPAENETIPVQDDAEELREETNRQHEAALRSAAQPSHPTEPIVVPDDSSETTTSTEHEDVS